MYNGFFGLAHAPFSIAPDPRYLYLSERHREALAHLFYGLSGGGGFVLLTGEIGAGKTTVCRSLLEQVPKRCNIAYLFNPKQNAAELLKSVCREFHAESPRGDQATLADHIDALNEYLLRTHAVGQSNVLIIDEAQSLSADVLEQLRLLTNLETNERKLLQIILIGQPELRTMLARPELEQLAQRVIARYHLAALSRQETAHYIAHRLAVAGASGPLPFDRGALQRIHAVTRGVPRRINLLCDRALLGAYAKGIRPVNGAIVEQAAQEVFGERRAALPWPGRGGPAWGAVLPLAAAVGVLAWGLAATMASSSHSVANWRQRTAGAASSPAAAPTAPHPSAAAASAPLPAATGAASLRPAPGAGEP